MRIPCYNCIRVLLMATIRTNARLHSRVCRRPSTRMVAINKLKTFVKTGKTHYKNILTHAVLPHAKRVRRPKGPKAISRITLRPTGPQEQPLLCTKPRRVLRSGRLAIRMGVIVNVDVNVGSEARFTAMPPQK